VDFLSAVVAALLSLSCFCFLVSGEYFSNNLYNWEAKEFNFHILIIIKKKIKNKN